MRVLVYKFRLWKQKRGDVAFKDSSPRDDLVDTEADTPTSSRSFLDLSIGGFGDAECAMTAASPLVWLLIPTRGRSGLS